MKFIDTHCHLYLEEFGDDLNEVVRRANEVGITKFLLPNIDSASLTAMNQLAEDFPDKMFPMIGLHPTSVKEDYKNELQIVENEIKNGKYIAVGEIGIDLYWDKTFLNFQQEALAFQIELALKYNLPIIIHMRDSYDEIMETLIPFKGRGLKGEFHCFSGNNAQAKSIIDFGFLLGIGGVLTFKNSGLANEIMDIDLKSIILETDAPYLAPVPHRGKRNESSYIPIIAQKLAEMHNCSIEEVAEITTQNALNLFNLSL